MPDAKMPISTLLAAILGLLVAVSACRQSAPITDPEYAIVATNVVDVVTGKVMPELTVLIERNRIRVVATTDTVRLSPDTEIIDGRDKYLIPGLWDMHVHSITDQVTRETFLPLYIAHGVTGVRDMSADCDTACADIDTSESTELSDYLHPSRSLFERWKADIESGAQVGPRLIGSSAAFDGPDKVWKSSYAISDATTARRLVGEAVDRGVDFIKVYSRLPRDVYFTVAKESKKHGIPMVGHLPISVSFEEALANGQTSFEHLGGITHSLAFHCLTDRESTLETYNNLRSNDNELAALRLIREAFDPESCEDLFNLFKHNNAALVPTLVAFDRYANLGNPELLADARLSFVVPRIKGMWGLGDQESKRAQNLASGGLMPLLIELNSELTVAALRSGVQVLPGSDTPNPFVFPGSALHDELMLFVDAGMTPAQALRSATLEPARFLKMEADLGSVETGKLADLVLLDKNPLVDIRNINTITAVIADGRLYDRQTLDELLHRARLFASE